MPSPARRSKQDPRRERVAALALQITLRAGVTADAKKEAPSEFRIFRAGVNPSEKGDFLFDEISAASVMAAYAMYGKPLAIDYNHGTSFPYPTPEEAKAAGWFTPAVRDGELWATAIDWTTAGAEYVASGEYGLFSPWFEHDGSEPARVTRLINCALTNLPALNHIDQLVAANANPENTMACEACTALNARLAKMEEECTALRAKLAVYDKDADDMRASATLRAEVVALTGQATLVEARGALVALKKKADRCDVLEVEVGAIRTKGFDDEFAKLLDGGVTALKITPAERAYWEGECKVAGHATEQGVGRLRGFLAVAASKAPGGPAGGAAGNGPPDRSGAAALSAIEIEIARKCGRDPADVAKFKAEQAEKLIAGMA